MTEDWIVVNIRQCAPKWIRNRATLTDYLAIDGQNVSRWMLENQIHWSYENNSPVLRFKREEDAALFKLRWL